MDVLEVVDEEAEAAPAPTAPPRPSLLARPRSRPTWPLAALALAVGLAAAYTAVAVTGVQAIEHQWRESEALSSAFGLRVAQAKERSPVSEFDTARIDASVADARAPSWPRRAAEPTG